MLDIQTILILTGWGVITTLVGVLLGGWLMFKGRSAVPNESFIGRQPKGEVFSITDGLDEPNFPGTEEPSSDEERILKKTGQFLQSLTGGK